MDDECLQQCNAPVGNVSISNLYSTFCGGNVVIIPTCPYRARNVRLNSNLWVVKQGNVYENYYDSVFVLSACPTASNESSDFVVVPERDLLITQCSKYRECFEAGNCSGLKPHSFMDDSKFREDRYLV